MGMSASQARLLSLTARMSDLEFRAQNIQNSKIRLSDESEGISRAYSDALNKEKLTVYNCNTNTNIDATAENLTTYGKIPNTVPRILKDSYGRVLVDGKVKAAYDASGSDLNTFLNNLGYITTSTETIKTEGKNILFNNLATSISTANSLITTSPNNGFTTNYTDNAVFTSIANNNKSLNDAWGGEAVPYSKDGAAVAYCFYADGKTSGNPYKQNGDLSKAKEALNSTISTITASATNAILAVLKEKFGENYPSIEDKLKSAASDASSKVKDFYNAQLTANKIQNQNTGSNNDTKGKVANTNQIWDDVPGNHELYIDLSQLIKTFLTYFDSACMTSISKDSAQTVINQSIGNSSTTRVENGNKGGTGDKNSFITSTTNATALQEALTGINTQSQEIQNTFGISTNISLPPISSNSSDELLNLKNYLSSIPIDTIKSAINTANINPTSELGQIIEANNQYTYDPAATKFYNNLFNEIQKNGYTGTSNENMGNSEWLYTQLNAGNLFLSVWDPKGGEDAQGGYNEVSWKSGDSSLKTTIDDADLARAEAEYNTAMASIQTKDKRFDLELKAIDTEHNATQTGIESVKKVIDKNIEKSFKTFEA